MKRISASLMGRGKKKYPSPKKSPHASPLASPISEEFEIEKKHSLLFGAIVTSTAGLDLHEKIDLGTVPSMDSLDIGSPSADTPHLAGGGGGVDYLRVGNKTPQDSVSREDDLELENDEVMDAFGE